MPVVSIPEKVLFAKLGRSYTEDEFSNLCFAYGLELDEITSEQELVAREQGTIVCGNKCSETIYKIDVPANRYDLLCAEGLTRALLIFQKKLISPEYQKTLPMQPIQMRVHESANLVRPFVVCAILRNITFNETRYASFIELQDKLHQNICRKRTLVAIGTHDLDTLQPPFVYSAKTPQSIYFRPLGQPQVYNAEQLMELYSKESHLKGYLDIIRDKPLYPVITDARDVILSMPPIINGEHSKIKMTTKNVFIECTATDLQKASIVLDTVVAMFSEYCAHAFSVEQVEVIQSDNSRSYFPRMEYRNEVISVDYVNSLLGINLSEPEIADLLTKMSLCSRIADDAVINVHKTQLNATGSSGLLAVRVPPTRHDILHPCDIAEDVAIAYGYDHIEEHLPSSYSIVDAQPLNRLTDMARAELAQCGFTEALTFSLCSRSDISTNLQKTMENQPAVHISNPKTLDFQVVRTTLLPGLLSTLANNRGLPLPLKLFEVQDVVLKDKSRDVGCRNIRRVCVVYCNKTAAFEVVHGVLDRLMQVLEVTYDDNKVTDKVGKQSYRLEDINDETYFPGRCANIILSPSETSIGRLGIVHPQVVQNFGLALCVSAFEIDFEPFL